MRDVRTSNLSSFPEPASPVHRRAATCRALLQLVDDKFEALAKKLPVGLVEQASQAGLWLVVVSCSSQHVTS